VKRSPPKPITPKPIKPITLGDNLNIRRRQGKTSVSFGARQTFTTKQVIHLMQAVAEQSLDEKTLAAAQQAIDSLTIVLAATAKGDPDQPLLPGMEMAETPLEA